MMNKKDFCDWLMKEKNFTPKSAGDVFSRMNRVGKYVDLTNKTAEAKMINDLSQNKTFQQLNVFVQSQLKRSIHLFYEFKLSQRKLQ